MLVYLRLSNVPEHQVEELFVRNIRPPYQAQAENKMLMTFFGNDLQSYCDELIGTATRPNKIRKTSLIGFVISLLLAIHSLEWIPLLLFSFSCFEKIPI